MTNKKSSIEELKKRGWAMEEDISALKGHSTEELFQKTDSPLAYERTAAIINLREKFHSVDEYGFLLLKRLCEEKALYTKIELCNSLQSGNEKTAQQMCEYLGKIGNNQHKEIPDTVSKKKCYPLPRDIIARTLGRMDKSVFPSLLQQLETQDRNGISELLDAIGYMVFYNPLLANKKNFESISQLYQRYCSDHLLIWRIARCCSAFPMIESIASLEELKTTYFHPTIQKEVERSTRLIVPKIK